MSICMRVARPSALGRSLRRSTVTFSTTSRRRADDPPSATAPAQPEADRKPAKADSDSSKAAPASSPDAKDGESSEPGSTGRTRVFRRRMSIRSLRSPRSVVPFDQQPYQCFQEARLLLQADRREKIQEILEQQAKVRRLEQTDPAMFRGGDAYRQKRLASLRRYIERLKILADINDPVVKMRFEDGRGDMSKPIYRFLAEKKWRGLPLRIIEQRLSQFRIVPDILTRFTPTVALEHRWRALFTKKAPAGAVLPSRVTEELPELHAQCFDGRDRLVTVVVLDSDVPDVERDSYTSRLHYLAVNVPLSATAPLIHLRRLDRDAQEAVSWLPPTAQLGSGKHRLTMWIMEQQPPRSSPPSSSSSPDSKETPSSPFSSSSLPTLDAAALRQLYASRDGFNIRSLVNRFNLLPIGFNMFRSEWDAGTAAVMARHGIPGADVKFKPRKYAAIKPPKKARGWEAKRQGPKYKFIWRLTKRIRQ